MSDSKYLILTCDGGGIRGLMTAMVIQKLNEEVNFLDKIDLFAGTSTGGLISLGLASGLPISQLVDIYSITNCPNIFKPYNPANSSSWLLKLLKNFLDTEEKKIIENIEDFVHVKYNNTGLKDILEKNLTEPSQFLESLQSNVLVATFQLENSSDKKNPSWRPITLDNLPNNSIKSEKTKILDAALCTSAAPTFFPPHQHPTYGYCVDGGVFANNPSTLALARVISSGILEEKKLKFQDIRMLSVGTGVNQNFIPPSYQPKGPLGYGVTTWLWPKAEGETPSVPLLSILMDGSSIIDDFQVQMFLDDTRYQRMNVELTKNISLDDCSQIPYMKELVDNYTKSDDWKKQKDWVQENFL